ncbi:TPA: phage tail protein [Staphylococcus aureus]|nr:phage tail protein [Staphylococcus aureus]
MDMYENHLISIMNFDETICENLEGVSYDTFKDVYTMNDTNTLEFTVYRTNTNKFEYNLLVCENFIIFHGEKYVIKSVKPRAQGHILSTEVIAHHVMYEFQNHYVEPLEEDDNSRDGGKAKQYTLREYLTYGFNNQQTDKTFTFKIYGEFKQAKEVDGIGGKNGIEFIKDGIELFDYVIYPNGQEIGFYQKGLFHQKTDKVVRYKYNTDTVQAVVDTLEFRTAIKAYGKKRTPSETKNYMPIKPTQMSYSSDFQKKSVWGTDKIGGKATVSIECKYGNETITYALKKGKDGGLFDVYLDDSKIGRYSCWNDVARTDTIDLIKHVKKGKHTLNFVFVGEDPKHKMEKGKKARYLVGTEKSNVINLIADLKGDENYTAAVTYISPNANIYGKRFANTIKNDQITNDNQLLKWARSQLRDEPKTELTVSYLDYDEIGPRDTLVFVHELMGFNTELKVNSITKGHPFTNKIDEVSFSNDIKDMVQIQQALNKKLSVQDNRFNYQEREMNKLFTSNTLKPFTTEVIGSVLE